METYPYIWLLAGVTGLVAAGLTGSAWAMFTGENPRLWMLREYRTDLPLRALVLVGYAPLAVTQAGLGDINRNPVFAFMVMATGLLWSFFQGVFILTAVFGFT
jgi:hypothetical protein